MEKSEQSAASSSDAMAAESAKGHDVPEGQRGAAGAGNMNKNQVYQFKITLRGSKPRIWRRILVPGNYNFRKLHMAIQDAMGWFEWHLHKFQMLPEASNPNEIGITHNEFGNPWGNPFGLPETISDKKVKIAERFKSPGDRAIYEYDFGDGWEHDILLEKIVPPIAGTLYPRCINGMRACPPEDCGGVYGYANFLKIISDPRHEEYDDMMDWLHNHCMNNELIGMNWQGGEFDPNNFDPRDVSFSNAKALA